MALTIRITKTEEKAIEELKEAFDIKTSSGVIKFTFSNYLSLYNALNKKSKELEMATKQISLIKSLYREKKQLEKRIDEFLIK